MARVSVTRECLNATVSPYERVCAMLAGETPDRVPVGVHSWEVAAREYGFKIREFCLDGEKNAQAQIAFQRKYVFDVVLLESGVGLLAEAMGCPMLYREDEPPVVQAGVLTQYEDVDKLRVPEPYEDGKLPEALKATRLFREAFGDEVFIIGDADQGPFNLAAQLRGTRQFMIDLAKQDNLEGMEALLEVATQVVVRYAQAQMECGAHAACIGESLAGPDLVSPEIYRRFAYPYDRQVGNALTEDGSLLALHICGDTTLILDAMDATKAAILEIDYKTDLQAIKQQVSHAVVKGTVNPVTFLSTPEEVRREAKRNLDVLKSTRRFILSSGCILSKHTPKENIRALFAAALQYGQYPLGNGCRE